MTKTYRYETGHGELELFIHDSGRKGKTLFVTAAIHGDEQCGTRALERLTADLATNTVQLKTGQLVFVKICNPLAYSQDRRFSVGGENLNRVFKKHSVISSPERAFANTLIDIVQKYVPTDGHWLDLHSYYDQGGKPFTIVEYPTQENVSFAKNLGLPDIFLGWNELYADNLDDAGNIKEPCTIDFGHSIGLSGLTVECGGHKDKASAQIAYDAIINALGYLGLSAAPPAPLSDARFVMMREIVRKPSEEWIMSHHWRNLDAVPQGTVLAIHKNGTDSGQMISSEDNLILLPSVNAQAGTEWFYLGKSLDI